MPRRPVSRAVTGMVSAFTHAHAGHHHARRRIRPGALLRVQPDRQGEHAEGWAARIVATQSRARSRCRQIAGNAACFAAVISK